MKAGRKLSPAEFLEALKEKIWGVLCEKESGSDLNFCEYLLIVETWTLVHSSKNGKPMSSCFRTYIPLESTHSDLRSAWPISVWSRLLQKAFDLIVRETELSENAEDIRRGQFSCSHVNRDHPLLVSKGTNVDRVIPFTFPKKWATTLLQQTDKFPGF